MFLFLFLFFPCVQNKVAELIRSAFSAKLEADATEELMEDIVNKKMFICSNVRATVQCSFCGKLRLVFCWAKDWKAHNASLSKILEESRYTCGAYIVAPPAPLSKIFVVKRDIRCDDTIQKLYFSQQNIPVPPICYHCGSAEEVIRDPELVSDYKCVYPQCKECRARKVLIIKTHYKHKTS
jgi:hypothetical protein